MKTNKTLLVSLLSCIALAITHATFAQISFGKSNANIGSSSYNCQVSDVNLDGKPDIYLVQFDKPDKLWLNIDGKAFKSTEQNIGNQVKFNRNVGIADLNGDNYPDLFIPNDANWNSGSVSDGLPNEIWINDGLGNFTDSGQRLGNSASNDVALGDIDGDGDIDAIVANFHNTNLDNPTYQLNKIWINDGAGNFSESNQDLGKGSKLVLLSDIDNDSDLDAVFTSQGDYGSTMVYLNNAGVFSLANNSINNCSAFSIGDIDNDGDNDLFLTHAIRGSSMPSEVWLNTGNGIFEDSGQRLGSINGSDIKLHDFDDDGDLDAILTDGIWKLNDAQMWINQGNIQDGTLGEFVKSDLRIGDFQIGKIAIADFNNDNREDLVITNYAGNDMVYINETGTTGMQRTFQTDELLLYPNPASNNIYIEFQQNISPNALFQIYNVNGNIVDEISILSKTMNIDISNYPKGAYFLKYLDANNIFLKVFIVL